MDLFTIILDAMLLALLAPLQSLTIVRIASSPIARSAMPLPAPNASPAIHYSTELACRFALIGITPLVENA